MDWQQILYVSGSSFCPRLYGKESLGYQSYLYLQEFVISCERNFKHVLQTYALFSYFISKTLTCFLFYHIFTLCFSNFMKAFRLIRKVAIPILYSWTSFYDSNTTCPVILSCRVSPSKEITQSAIVRLLFQIFRRSLRNTDR